MLKICAQKALAENEVAPLYKDMNNTSAYAYYNI